MTADNCWWLMIDDCWMTVDDWWWLTTDDRDLMIDECWWLSMTDDDFDRWWLMTTMIDDCWWLTTNDWGLRMTVDNWWLMTIGDCWCEVLVFERVGNDMTGHTGTRDEQWAKRDCPSVTVLSHRIFNFFKQMPAAEDWIATRGPVIRIEWFKIEFSRFISAENLWDLSRLTLEQFLFSAFIQAISCGNFFCLSSCGKIGQFEIWKFGLFVSFEKLITNLV